MASSLALLALFLPLVPLRAIVHGDTVAFVVSGGLTLALWTLLALPFSPKRE